VLGAYRYDRAAGGAEEQLAGEFARTFPGWPAAGANVRAVIESEHRKLLAVAAPDVREAASGRQANALRMMVAVLNNLPKDVRFQIDRMTFEDNGFELQGRLRNFEDGGKL